MTANHGKQVMDAWVYAHHQGLLRDEAGQRYDSCLRHGVADDFVITQLMTRVSRHKIEQAFAGPFKAPKLRAGEEVRGTDESGQPVRTPVQYRNGHSLIVCGSGAGKSMALVHGAMQVLPHVKGLWAVDVKKKEFRVLRALVRSTSRDMVRVTSTGLRINPLQVPRGLTPQAHASAISETIGESQDFPPRSIKLLLSTILRLYGRHGVLDGAEDYPSLYDLFLGIKSDKDANYQSRMALLDGLEPLLRELGPGALAYRQGWNVQDLEKQRIHFDFSGTSHSATQFVLSTFMLNVFTTRIARNLSNAPMNLCIVLDEAGQLISASRPNRTILNNFELIRGTGVGLCVSATSADVHPVVFSNCSNKLLGRCGNNRDYEAIASVMGLTREQQQYIRHHLEPGLFVEQLGEGWRYPYLLRTPLIQTPRDLIAEESGDTAFASLPVVPAPVPPEFDTAAITLDDRPRQPSKPVPKPPPVDESAQRYLQAIIDHPGKRSSDYIRLARIGSKKAQQLRRELVRDGYLREHVVSTSARGRTAIVLETLDKAVRHCTNAPQNGE